MEIVVAAVVGVVCLVVLGSMIWWVCDRSERRRVMSAGERVFREYPQYVQTHSDFEIFARKLMRELNQDTITFTFRLND